MWFARDSNLYWMDWKQVLCRSAMRQAVYKLKQLIFHVLFAQSQNVPFTHILQYLEACSVIELWSIVINISTQRKGGWSGKGCCASGCISVRLQLTASATELAYYNLILTCTLESRNKPHLECNSVPSLKIWRCRKINKSKHKKDAFSIKYIQKMNPENYRNILWKNNYANNNVETNENQWSHTSHTQHESYPNSHHTS
jgi:hypothetical protein